MIDYNTNHDAKEKLFNDNIKLANFCLSKRNIRQLGYLSYEDLQQIAYMGLWKACCSFDTENKTKFSTYACLIIEHEIFFAARKINKESAYIFESIDDEDVQDWKYVSNENIEDSIANRISLENIYKAIDNGILSERQVKIFCYMLENETQSEIANKINSSQSQVYREMKKIRKILSGVINNN